MPPAPQVNLYDNAYGSTGTCYFLITPRVPSFAARQEPLTKIEGPETFAGLQRFLNTVHTLCAERRLSRLVFLAQRIP